jgi:hypothetical protein
VKRANYFVAQQDSSSDDDSSDSTDSEPWMSKGSVRRKTISFEAVPVLKVWHRKCLVLDSHQGSILWNFFGRNLWIFIISYSVCPWQAFPA